MDVTANTNASTVVRACVCVRAGVRACMPDSALHIFVCECSLTPRMTGLFEVKSNNRTLLRRVYVCVPECRTFVSIPREEFWMYKFVISPQRFMVLSRFSAPRKPIRTVKGTPRHHLVHFFWFSSVFHLRSLFFLFLLTPFQCCFSCTALLSFYFLSLPSFLSSTVPPSSFPSTLFPLVSPLRCVLD